MQIGSSAATRAAFLAGLLVFAAGPSRAADFTLEVLQGGGSIGSFDETDFSCVTLGVNTENCQAGGIDLGDLVLDSITLDIDPDPFIAGDFAVTNTGATSNFTFIFTATVAPIAINTLTSGSAAGGVTDGSGDGAFINTVNSGHSAFYAALIDNLLYDTLIPFPISDSNPTVGGSADLPPNQRFGDPHIPANDPNQPGPPVVSTVGITWDFAMGGAGDVASFSGTFKVKPVPEPATALLLGLGLATLARVGRRR